MRLFTAIPELLWPNKLCRGSPLLGVASTLLSWFRDTVTQELRYGPRLKPRTSRPCIQEPEGSCSLLKTKSLLCWDSYLLLTGWRVAHLWARQIPQVAPVTLSKATDMDSLAAWNALNGKTVPAATPRS